jgi:S-adenosylmethionine:tRNA ribosyltransferase-isomerase
LVLRGEEVAHEHFSDLPKYLGAGDVLVLNQTRVIPARLTGRRIAGGSAEVLLLRPLDRPRYDPSSTHWSALVRPGRKLPIGAKILFEEFATATVVDIHDDGVRDIEFSLRVPFEELLARCGRMPLPPYIHNDSDDAQARYQTVFAAVPGSVAAPTASLHFTNELLASLDSKGVEIAKIVLDVGLGTFRPIQTARLDDHDMHAESYDIPQATVDSIERAKRDGRRVIAAGTTVVRALEGNVQLHGALTAGQHSTDIFISPGFEFALVDALITNFHLPESSLLVLVSAFAGRERILAAYRQAIAHEYRFFSFGDAMLIVRTG